MTSPPRDFEFHECLGRGGFGEVYRATMTGQGRPAEVAVKILHEGVDVRHQSVERIVDEARILRTVRHPVVPTSHGITVIDRRMAMIVEYVDGIDLNKLNKLDARPALLITERVASALHAAWVTEVDGVPIHVVHRDIKPANIRLRRDGAVKLLDFGIARLEIGDRQAHTGTGDLLGSVPYLAPERLLKGDSGPGQDVYALGATLFEVMFRRRLFASSLEQVYGILADPESHAEHLEEQVVCTGEPNAVRDLLLSMLAYHPEARPTAEAVAARAKELANGLPGDTLQELCSRFAEHERPRMPGPLTGKTLREVRPRTAGGHTDHEGLLATVIYDGGSKRLMTPLEASPPPAPAAPAPPSAPAVKRAGTPRTPVRTGSLWVYVQRNPTQVALGTLVFLVFLVLLGASVFGLVFALA